MMKNDLNSVDSIYNVKKQEVILRIIEEECEFNGGYAPIQKVLRKVTLLNITPEQFDLITNRLWDRGFITKTRTVIRMTELGEKLFNRFSEF